MIFFAIALPACTSEADVLRERVETLEGENADLQSTVTSLRTELERSQADLSNTQFELHRLLTALDEAAAAEEQGADGAQSGPLAITYAGEPNQDMSWPLNYGNLQLGIRVNFDELGEGADISWRSTNENVFTVNPSEDGLSAMVTPIIKGSAEMVVTVGDQETRSWIRIT